MTVSSTRTLQRTTVAAAVAFAIAASSAHAAQSASASDTDTTGESAELQEVIVTGTRQGGLEAAESPAPVQILSAEALRNASGNPDLMSTLAQIVPSLTMEAFGFDQAGQTLMAKLRGLSPNDVLILVNGKRRHTTANLAIDTGSTYQGGANVDLNFIPVDAIDHIEVLTEGAAAQYGSDAIAGVINIILKKNSSGGTLSGTDGRFMDNQGPTSDVSGNIGLSPYDGSYFNVTGEVHNHGHTQHTGLEPQAIQELGTYPNSNMTLLPGYPYVNMIEGDAESHVKLAMVNAGMPITDSVEVYLTGSYGYKDAASYENYRTPEHVSYTAPGAAPVYPFPFGFNPEEQTNETDYQGNVGIKGTLMDWNWDIGTGFGADHVDMYTINSIGDSFEDNGLPTPSNFYDGFLQSTQWTSNADFNRDFDVGMAGPLNVAFGAEYRLESYSIGAGIPESYIDGGAQSFPGFTPTDAGDHNRKNESVYIDLAGKPIDNLRVDLAGRYEHYSDFGNAEVGKLTMRYDFSPEFAVRGTINNGFRAPTLAEEYYSATNVGPTTAFVQLPPNSAGGKVIGLGTGLEPEKSMNYSLGLVFRPLPNMSMTLDAFSVLITNRIVGTGDIFGTIGGVPTAAAPFINAAIAANGNQLDPAVVAHGTTGINVFDNGIDTVTRGFDFVFQYGVDYPLGHVNYSIGATYNDTYVSKIPATPPQFVGQTLYDATATSDLTSASPKFVVNLGANWAFNNMTINLVEKLYGPSHEYDNDSGLNPYGCGGAKIATPCTDVPENFLTSIGVTPITNLDIGWKFTKNIRVNVGANNLFNRFPPFQNGTLTSHYFVQNYSTAVQVQPIFSPFGIDGGFYYGKITLSF
jgi:iron complex outermembrane receptor protein